MRRRGCVDQVTAARFRRIQACASLVAVAALLALPSVAIAQRISGTVQEAEGGRLIPGGFVSLLDAAGEAVQADFTGADGGFSLAAPGPGEYRIRVQRIGYANWVTEPHALAAAQTLAITVEVPRQPVRLGDLRVEVTGSCLDDPRQGEALATVWEEARKALETAVWAEDRGEVTFTLTEYERTLDPRSLTTLEAESRTRRNVRLPPFRSLPARRLMTEGYAVVDRDSSVFYAPDATVLLSEEFRDTHCFGLRRDEVEGEARLGLTFRPQRRSDVVQIEGTLWLDEASAALREVRLQYRNVPLPRGADRRRVGANLVFDRLPDGPFYVRDWWIRFPIAGEPFRRTVAGLSLPPQTVLVAYRQTGGRVADALVGGRAFGTGEGVVAGILRDSVSGEPLGGADIVLREWDDAAVFLPRPAAAEARFSALTDEAGAFRVAGLPDGVYALGVDHPRLRTAGIHVNERRVVVEDRTSPPVELWLPSAEPAEPSESDAALEPSAIPFAGEECGERASLAVTVRDESGLVVMPNATVVLRWSDAVRRPVREDADADGRLFLCAPRDARQATLWAEFGEDSSEEAVVAIEPGQARDVELRLLFGETRTGRLVGRVRDARTRQAVAAAEISLTGRAEVVQSNRSGRFVLSGLPVGAHELSVRHLGYAPLSHSVAVERGLTTDVEIGLSPNPLELEPLVATVIRPRHLETRGFYERRQWAELNGAGTFFTVEDIERRSPARITHMIAEAPGVRLADCGIRGFGCQLYGTRISTGFSDRPCKMNVFLDGSLVIQGSDDRWRSGSGDPPESINDYVLPSEIAAVEVYRGASGLPAEFSGYDARCGAVAIWTK